MLHYLKNSLGRTHFYYIIIEARSESSQRVTISVLYFSVKKIKPNAFSSESKCYMINLLNSRKSVSIQIGYSALRPEG